MEFQINSVTKGGPIIIGKNNIIEEHAIIINRALIAKESLTPQGAQKPMQIGHSNHFQVGCQVYAQQVGDCNSFEIRCNDNLLAYN